MEPGRKAPRKERSRWAGMALTTQVTVSGNMARAVSLATTQLARDPPYAMADKLRWQQDLGYPPMSTSQQPAVQQPLRCPAKYHAAPTQT